MIEQLEKTYFDSKELDVMGGIAIVTIHIAEKIMRAVVTHYENEYRKRPEYDALCKQYGRIRVEKELKEHSVRVVKGEERLQLWRAVEAGKKALQVFEQVTSFAIDPKYCTAEDVVKGYDALMADTDYYGRLIAMLCNCDNEQDALKIESTIKVLSGKWSRGFPNDNILKLFETK